MDSSSLIEKPTGLRRDARRWFAPTMVVLILSWMVAGCYVLQAATGQMAVMAKRRPIAAVIANPQTPPAVRAQLESVRMIRDFASRELHLPDNGSYRKFADIHRPFVVWNVVAAPEFSLRPLQWCFPIAGCVAYRGYFKERDARAFAAALRSRGYDVVTGGVTAYSTLGHFDDPILSSMLGWSDVELAAIVFHELAHQLLYVPGDSDFNEALATVVEREGVRRWLSNSGRGKDLENYELQEGRVAQVVALLIEGRAALADAYRLPLPAEEMRRRKALEFAHLREQFTTLKAGWGAHAPFETWFGPSLNNANLASVATYRACVPGLERVLTGAGGDLPRFYAKAREIAALSADRRHAQACGAG